MSFDPKYSKTHQVRFERTLRFLERNVQAPAKVLDLGPSNPFGQIMTQAGFEVTNTKLGVDLDLEYEIVKEEQYEVVTAFEIFEHMVAPFNLLREIKADKLVASIPLKLWFANAYWNEKDPWDRHYHEFEPRQFDMLLEKAGWKIVDAEKWTSPAYKIGVRPLLRRITPRYYIVSCVRI
ncbi:methyltransferase [Reichenbachiella sp. 5M10]|uniref:methyltransferase domain-containing protein n=1 Tax=Reichenbachiella sp. 5M10 TaxID=1889772 RepID=UPI000C156B93|nr:methyltransferase domain-containing protein [Reichenbachiella sp. 5M10]PIB34768.1 methyltransferase [Reichenbachiella sp. 5M10]